MAIPVIDLPGTFWSDARDRLSVARDVRDASRASGVFFVMNHGVPAPLMASHFEIARSFFALDLAEKRAIDVRRIELLSRIRGVGDTDDRHGRTRRSQRRLHHGPDLAPDHPHVLARYPNTGANLWPLRPPGFRRHMETYVDAMNRLGRRLAGVLALSLDLPEDYFSAARTDPLTYSQLLYYPSLPARACGNRLGAGAHVDWGLLTILLQDEVGGLEVRAPDASWHAAIPVPGTFVIILGEMILRLTDGLYRSAMHRVAKNTSGRSRYSMPTFFDPGYDLRVACVPSCRPAHGEPRYRECTVAEHMREMAHTTLSTAEPILAV